MPFSIAMLNYQRVTFLRVFFEVLPDAESYVFLSKSQCPTVHPLFDGVLEFTSTSGTAQGGGGSFKNRKPIG